MEYVVMRSMVAVMLLCGCGFGFAEDLVVKSSPVDGAVLTGPPVDVRVWFAEAPELDSAQLVVSGPVDVALRMLHTMGENDLMAFVVGEVPDGGYTLRWQFADKSGEITFSVKRPGDVAADR